MASFKYRAISQSGETVSGVLEASDQISAVAVIKKTCSVILEIQELQIKEIELSKGKKIDVKTLSLMCERFAIILSVGLPIVKAVDLLASQMEDKILSAVLKEISKEISMGNSLATGFSSRKDIFPVTFIESVHSGEESGNLAETFDRLSKYYDRSSKTKQKVISALTYPAITMVVAVVVMIIIMVVAVPAFTESFAQMGAELPAITQFVIGLSNFVINYGIFVVLVIAAIIIACKLYQRTEKGATLFSSLALGMPILGKVLQLTAASQFAHTMSMMLASGMPIISCLETSGKSIGNYVMRRDILATAVGIEEGKSLATCMGKSKFLPAMLVEMVAMGETTGTLETTLNAVAGFYDNEVEISTERAMSVLEPLIICVLAVFVVIILLSVYLPMFGMYGGIA